MSVIWVQVQQNVKLSINEVNECKLDYKYIIWVQNGVQYKMECKIDKWVMEVQKWAQMRAKWIIITLNGCKMECKIECNVKVSKWSAEMSATSAK